MSKANSSNKFIDDDMEIIDLFRQLANTKEIFMGLAKKSLYQMEVDLFTSLI